MDDVKQFFKTYYTPNNLSLCLAGDFDPLEAKPLIEKYYGSLLPGPALDRPGISPVSLDGEKIVEVNDRVPQDRVYMVWPSQSFFADREPEVTMASIILTDGLSSRLNRKLVYDEKLCSNVFSFNDAGEIAGMFIIMATARAGVHLQRIEEIVTDEIRKLAQNGPTKRELIRAKTKWEYDYISGLERIGGMGGKADRLNAYNTYLGDPGKFEEDFIRHRRVSREGVKRAVEDSISTRNRLLVRFHPEVSQRTSVPVPDRTQIPPLGLDKPFNVPNVQSANIGNGLEIYVVERHDLPKVAVVFGTKAGSIEDPPDKTGVAHLALRTIDRGTKSRGALEIEDALGDLGTSLHGFAAREMSYLSLDVLKSNLAGATSILADVVLHPAFLQQEFKREQELHLDALRQESSNPNVIASRIRSMLALGPTHPYGRPLRGFPASIESITRADLENFHHTFWSPERSVLVFVGDVTLEEAKTLSDKYFRSWKSVSRRQITIPSPQPFAFNKIYLVDRQDAAQTAVAQVLPGPSRLSDEYFPLRLADAVWGSGFMTRLNLNLRENKGYTYGASSALALYTKAGFWYAGASVQTDKTKETVIEFINELRDLAGAKPISESELAAAKTNRVRGFAQQFETFDRIAGIVTELWSFDLPMSELQREPVEFANVTLEVVNNVAQRYAKLENSMLLLVGDRSKIEEPVRSLNLGEVVVLDDEGKLVG